MHENKILEVLIPFIFITVICFFISGGFFAYSNKSDTDKYKGVTTVTMVKMDEDSNDMKHCIR